jgi:hypothetical protein
MLYYNNGLTDADNDKKTNIALLLLLSLLVADDLYFVVCFSKEG